MSGTTSATPSGPSIIVLGVPLDENSSHLRGAAEGPARIREALHGESTNMCCENGLDLGGDARWSEMEDLCPGSGQEAMQKIEGAVGSLLARGLRTVSIGGDHSITYPILRAFARAYPGLGILHIDAHPDTYDEFQGSRLSHACPFARIMEERLAERLVQVGIRTSTAHQREQAERFGVETIDMRSWNPETRIEFDGPVYLSLDLDALDPAFAPGVSHPEPGGFTTRDVVRIIQEMKGDLVGADLVELNPSRDVQGISAAAAAKLLKEILARMLTG